jgi:hypothetical protein
MKETNWYTSCTYTYLHIYTCIHMYVFISIYVYIYIHIYIHTYIYRYITLTLTPTFRLKPLGVTTLSTGISTFYVIPLSCTFVSSPPPTYGLVFVIYVYIYTYICIYMYFETPPLGCYNALYRSFIVGLFCYLFLWLVRIFVSD